MTTASIVTYHTRWDELEHVLQCIERSPIDKLWIVDHGNDIHLPHLLEDHPVAEYLSHPNLGYGSGHNVALKKAMELGSDYHIVMNSDLWWTEPVIEELADYMDHHPDVGLMMPMIYYPNGKIQYQCKFIPTPLDLILRGFTPDRFMRKHKGKFQLENWSYDRILNVPYLNGCFMFLRISVLREIGLFDERFFMYPEDIDLSRRIHEKYLTLFYPYVSITHVLASESKHNKALRRIHITNMIKYFNKWGWIFDSKRRKANRQLREAIR